MPTYSIAMAKDKFASLIDKAIAGEEVIITRHGKVVAEINPPREAADTAARKAEIYARMRRNLEAMPTMATSYLDMKRQDEADGAL